MSFVAAAAAVAVVACSTDTTNGTTDPAARPDAGATADSGASTTNDGGGSGAPPVPVQASGTTIFTVDADLPFAAKNVYAATGPVLDAHWGNHGGPMVTTDDTATPANPPTVTRYTVSGGAMTAAPAITSVNPTGLPGSYFWTAEGFVDLPFDDLAVASYSTADAESTGEAFLFSKNYDTVVARADVNAFYAARGVTDGVKTRLVYSAGSGLAMGASTTSVTALYASDVAATSLDDSAAIELFGWSGFEGPVATDNDGNVFVAASITGGAHTDAIYAVSESQALGTASVTQATILDADTKGTDVLAVAEVKGSGHGWVFAKGYDAATPASVYAHAYAVANGTVTGTGATVAAAIVPAGKNALSVFGSPDGNLWVAVKGDSSSWFVELAPKAH